MHTPRVRPETGIRIAAVSDQTPVSTTLPSPAPLAPEAVRAGFRAIITQAVETFGATAPNPSVGCALLDAEGRILATGTHPRAGQPHAEAMALAQARDLGVLARAHTALVTLEPCNHTGRTPPCSEALRASPVRDVWIGARDPNLQASGGIDRLRALPDGKRVFLLSEYPDMADLARDCAALLAPFASRVMRGRPWISVKQALDPHGSMIPPAGQTTFTSASSLDLAHRLRRATDAIVTGIGTVLADQPRFTVRRIPDHPARAPRLLVICDRHNRTPKAWRAEMERHDFEVILTRDLEAVPELMAARGINWAMIEAGPTLLHAVRRTGLWDDWLTIRKGAEQDTIELDSGAESPLRLLREETCFLAS